MSSDSDGPNPLTHSWNFDDGTPPETDSDPLHVFYQAGTYDVELTVDDGADTDDETKQVSVQSPFPVDSPPVAVIGVSGGGPTFSFDGSHSYDPDGDTISSWEWDFDSDGTFDASGQSVSHLFGEGSHDVVLVVTANGKQGHATVTVLWLPGTDRPPVASFNWYPYYVELNETVVQFVNSSYDLDCGITCLSYSWNFGDPASGADNTSSVRNPEHVFFDDGGRGYFDVMLNVSDGTHSSSIQKRVFVGQPTNNTPPVAAFSYSPSEPVALQVVQFTDLSFDFDGSIVSREWNVGGTSYSNPAYPVFPHLFVSAGNYNASLEVSDDLGMTDFVLKTVNVGSAPPGSLDVPSIVSVSATDAVLDATGTGTSTVRVECTGGIPGFPGCDPPRVEVKIVDGITQQEVAGIPPFENDCLPFEHDFVVSESGSYRAVANLKCPYCNVCQDGAYFSTFKSFTGWENVPETHPALVLLVFFAVWFVLRKRA